MEVEESGGCGLEEGEAYRCGVEAEEGCGEGDGDGSDVADDDDDEEV